MRKASYVLGLVGGCLALVGALLYILGGIFVAVGGTFFYHDIMQFVNHFVRMPDLPFNWLNTAVIGFGGVLIIMCGIMYAVAGILGIVGARSVESNNVKAGVLMLVAAGLALFAGFGFFLMVLLLLGGIFALVKDKKPDAQKPELPPQE